MQKTDEWAISAQTSRLYEKDTWTLNMTLIASLLREPEWTVVWSKSKYEIRYQRAKVLLCLETCKIDSLKVRIQKKRE